MRRYSGSASLGSCSQIFWNRRVWVRISIPRQKRSAAAVRSRKLGESPEAIVRIATDKGGSKTIEQKAMSLANFD
jgi:hypothetical protein